MSKIHKEEKVSIYIYLNPRELRQFADQMEARMKEAGPGDRVWSETFRDGSLEVALVTDQTWFHRRAEGIPDWDVISPGAEAIARFPLVKDESWEFPSTYSGQAWRAAYRIWKAAQEHGPDILDVGPYDDIKGVETKDLDTTGFMYGWAVNAVRQMLGKSPGANPAIVTIGGPQHVVPASGPADEDMKKSMGA